MFLATSTPTTRSTSSGPASQAGMPNSSRSRSNTPVAFAIVTGLNPRADHDATNPSTHAAWNASPSNGLAATAAAPEISRKPRPLIEHLLPRHTIEGDTYHSQVPP